MKKVWKLFPIFFLLVLLFTGCTPKENKGDETQEQSGAPMIDYEVPDKEKDYDLIVMKTLERVSKHYYYIIRGA